MSAEPKNPYIGKHDPQRESDWDDGFEGAREHFAPRIADLEAQVRERDEALRVARIALDTARAWTYGSDPKLGWHHVIAGALHYPLIANAGEEGK